MINHILNIDTIKNDIINTGYVENKKLGGTFRFKFPSLDNVIRDLTKELDNTLYDNKLFRSRVIFILKYDADIENIKKNNKWCRFIPELDDFICSDEHYVKNGWEKIKNTSVDVLYSLNETIQKLKNNNYYKNFLGRSKNRTMMKVDIKLYKSIYHHTSFMDDFNRNSKQFSCRLIFLTETDGKDNNLKCKTCNNAYVSFDNVNKKFVNECKECFIKSKSHYPTKNYFKKKYGDDWYEYYTKDRELISSIKVNSEEWFISKYGHNIGVMKYKDYVKGRVENINTLKISKVSKISQQLFWLICDNLSDEEKSNCFFHEKNHEKMLLTQNGKFYFPDFVIKNKIIEYDGSYWHDDKKDNNRNESYKELGFDVLVITDKDFNRQNINIDIVNKYVKYIRDEV